MCDEEKLARWAKEGLSGRYNRREFAMLAGMATVAACAPASDVEANDETDAQVTLPAMREENVSFATADGTMDAFWVVPQTNPAPAVLFWPDIAGIRDAKRDMARRLAGNGYAVLVVNPYYRDVVGEQFADFSAFRSDGGFRKVGPWRKKLTAEAIMRDAVSAVAWLDAQPEVDTARGIGTQGYCMGGPFTFWSAAAVPDRVKGVASFHGGGLVRDDDPMSPHLTFDDTQAGYLVAISQDDDAKAPDHKAILREAAAAAGRPAEIGVYAGDHGWTVPDFPIYAEAAAERAWSNLLELYGAHL